MKEDEQNTYRQIPHNRLTLGREEEEAAVNVIRSGWLAQGKEVEKFEIEFCHFLNISIGSAVAVSSGTAGLYLSLLALQASGKKVAIPVYTCSALRHAVTLVNGSPILIDCAPQTPNINITAAQLLGDIAIIPHMFGIPQAIQTYNGLVIEDCAQSLGAIVHNVPVGLQGDVGVYSFYATKLLTSGGQGGMVVSKNRSVIDFIKDYRIFDQRKDDKVRFNFQMTDLQAAIGRVQLQKFPQFIKRRAEIYETYKNAGLPLLDVEQGIHPVRFRAILSTPKQHEVIKALEKENIKAVIPLKSSEIKGEKARFSNAFSLTKNTVSLPIYPTLSDNDVVRIIQVVTNVL